MQQTPAVNNAVEKGELVVACAYQGWVPEEIKAQLPADFDSQSWAAEIDQGKITRLQVGNAEYAATHLLARLETDSPATKAPAPGVQLP